MKRRKKVNPNQHMTLERRCMDVDKTSKHRQKYEDIYIKKKRNPWKVYYFLLRPKKGVPNVSVLAG